MRVRCPNCRNEQDLEKLSLERCIVCGEVLFANNKLKAKVIRDPYEFSSEEVNIKFLCEKCQKEKGVILNKKEPTHLVCPKCRRF